MKIGQLAKNSGLSAETIRFYEREGLVRAVDRRPSGYRVFHADDVKTLRFIKQSRHLGFSLSDIKELLGLRLDSPKSCDEVRIETEQKIKDIASRIEQLQGMKLVLTELVGLCAQNKSVTGCPIIEAFGEESNEGSSQ